MEEKKELWQYFFKKPKKYYNKYMFEMEKYQDYIMYDEGKILSYKGDWKSYFQNEHDIYLEIGCGSGNFTVKNAEKFSDRNYLALELRLKRLVFGGKKARKMKLENLLFLRIRGEKLMDFLAPNEIAGIYINFPDPWEGEEHKRLFSKDLLDKLVIILKENGKIYFKTDHLNYYEQILKIIAEHSSYEIVSNTEDLYSTDKIKENIQTEFEQMFLSKHNMKIKYIEIKKL